MTRAAFFDAVRPIFGGSLTQPQVQGIEILLTATEGLPIGHRAYLLATAKHETANTMQPVREALAKTDAGAAAALEKAWKAGKLKWVKTPYWRFDADGKAWFGRGYVQLTWDYNYEKADKELGLRGALLHNFDLAMSPKIAVQILFTGMEEGWFTGKSLSTYTDYLPMRRIINGTDKASLIAGYAVAFEKALREAGYGLWPVPKPTVPDIVQEVPPLPKPEVKQHWLAALIAAIVAFFKKG